MSDQIAESQSLGLGRYVTVLKRRRYVVLLGVLLGLAAGVLYLQAKQTHSTAYTLVNINVISSDPFTFVKSPSELLDSQNEIQSARSSDVLKAAATTLGTDQPILDMRANLDVSLLQNGTVVRVTYQADTPRAAREGADAIAESYLVYRGAQAAKRADTIVGQLEAQKADAIAALTEANKKVSSTTPGSSARIDAESDQQAALAEINSISTSLNSLYSLDTNGGNVYASAADNPVTTSPRRVLTLASGLGAGLLLGEEGRHVRLVELGRAVQRHLRPHRLEGGAQTGTPEPVVGVLQVVGRRRVHPQHDVGVGAQRGHVVPATDHDVLGRELLDELVDLARDGRAVGITERPGRAEDRPARVADRVVDVAGGLALLRALAARAGGGAGGRVSHVAILRRPRAAAKSTPPTARRAGEGAGSIIAMRARSGASSSTTCLPRKPPD